jgi:hypothetical protein
VGLQGTVNGRPASAMKYLGMSWTCKMTSFLWPIKEFEKLILLIAIS